MNWQHLQAFVWLRWRLMINQWRRAGTLNFILMMILTIGTLAAVVPLVIGCFLIGLYAIPKAAPVHLLYAWDGLVVAFVFLWSVGLVTELQRSDPLSLSKFMHLPVSPTGAFLINYLSSLFRLSLLIFGPVMLAFCLALLFTKGLLLVVALPLMAAFLLMITALTYQLQGWLGSLMSNPRRRRTVIVATTAIFILIVQLPNLLNFFGVWGPQRGANGYANVADEIAKVGRDAQSKKFDSADLERRLREVAENHKLAQERPDREFTEHLERTVRLANMVLPIGWLPLGVVTAAEGHVIPAILGLLGMTTIGMASLWRAYRTTLGMYQAESSARKGRPALSLTLTKPTSAHKPGAPELADNLLDLGQVKSPASARNRATLLLEARIPGCSEPVSAIALGGLRSLMRSPEAKMMLLSPLIMSAIFGSMLMRGRNDIPTPIRPLVGVGAMAVVLFGVLQLMANQFGFDRDGFRVFVLSAARRRDILLGKNLTFAPLALGMAAILLLIVQFACPMRLDHFLAMIPQYVSMFLMFCILTNLLSIYGPLYIAAGSLKASNPKLATVLLQLVMFAFIFPLTQGATLLPLAIEALFRQMGWFAHVPICLLLSIAECAAIVAIYRLLLDWQGSLLQGREQSILETVTTKGS